MKSEIGNTYGELTVLEFVGKFKTFNDGYLCRCSCGETLIRSLYRMKVGHTKTCGCGTSKYKLYREYKEEHAVFSSMWRRCKYYNPASHKSYFDKNISLCPRWDGDFFEAFSNFIEDMGRRPTKDHEIDRKDSNCGYSKENCRWVPRRVNALNKERTVSLSILGERVPLKFITDLFEINWCTARDRILNGLPFHIALSRGNLRNNKEYIELKASGFTYSKNFTGFCENFIIFDPDTDKRFEETFGEFLIAEFREFESCGVIDGVL